jgi:hypothetical protein
MPKISVTIALNVKLRNTGSRDDSYDRFQGSLTISDIDTERSIERQIEAAIAGSEKVWVATSNSIMDCVNKELERNVMEG